MCGSSSLIHVPLWPCCANLKMRRRDRETSSGPLVIVGEPLALADRVGQVLAALLRQLRLVVEEVHLRRRAGLEQVDDALRLRREVRQPGQPPAPARPRAPRGASGASSEPSAASADAAERGALEEQCGG